MRIETLKSLVRAAREVEPNARIVVFGSASAFATYPTLGAEVSLYDQTFDADFILDPWDEATGIALTEAIGKASDYFENNKYYADIIRPVAYENFPPGFADRLVALDGFQNVFALDPNDMAVAKLIAGRHKDVCLLSALLAMGKLDEAIIRTRLWFMPMDDKLLVKSHHTLRAVVAAAKEQGYRIECPEMPWKAEIP